MMPTRRIPWARPRPDRATAPEVRAERGAILVQVAAMMLGLTALSAFIVDYGILWTARRQIQNTADAAAMAAAVTIAFGDPAEAADSARTAVAQNFVWGAQATADVAQVACPTGSVGVGTCVRVQAFRNQASGSPLPTVFASLVGVNDQGVRATATAQVLYGGSSDCVRPIAIPDRWTEFHNNAGGGGWDPLDTFERYTGPGPVRALLPSPDVYVPPGGIGANGTGYSRMGGGGFPADYGVQVRFAPQQVLNQPVGNERFVPVRITPGAVGQWDMLRDMSTCVTRVVQPGADLSVETDNADMPTREGLDALISQDPSAFWDTSLNGGRGGVRGGCMASGACTVSPRIVPIVAFDPDAWDQQAPFEPNRIAVVSRLVGVFFESYQAPFFVARLMGYPTTPRSNMTADPQSSFVISVALVR
jgi:Flp pilus assembly protein TadG